MTDAIASLVMVFGATWSLAYALAVDGHVKIDVLNGVYSRTVARVSLFLGLVTTTAFSPILAWQAWVVTMSSWRMGSFLPLSLLEMRLAWPQAIGALGYSILVL